MHKKQLKGVQRSHPTIHPLNPLINHINMYIGIDTHASMYSMYICTIYVFMYVYRSIHTFTSWHREVPVAADPVEARERGLSDQRVARQALERHRHAHTEVVADHNAVLEGPWVGAALQLVGCTTDGHGMNCGARVHNDSEHKRSFKVLV